MSLQNVLDQALSPYLRQHAGNPVHWQMWEEDTFEKARQQDKPIFLSIGYATCHWCHVMAHESFEDKNIAHLMNQAFINIKVDREERPDIDNTYMLVCQMLTGSGGWPLNIIMTPEKKPFYAATYIPKKGRHGRPGMLDLIPRISQAWENDREQIHKTSQKILQAFKKSTQEEAGPGLQEEILDECFNQLRENYDQNYGGFGNAPKFPSAHMLCFLMRYWNRTGNQEAIAMVKHTLEQMRRGGLFDQIGYGFHRYSTDRKWLLPHFEKMLYDQAMLMMAYTEAWQITGKQLFRQTIEETATYVLRDLQSDTGGFFSAEDADSEGEEGKFYVWSTDEIRQILPEKEADLAIECFSMQQEGNFLEEASGERTGKNILHFSQPFEELAKKQNLDPEDLRKQLSNIQQKIFNIRKQRERPLLDDKILTDWNGLMITALARAGSALQKSTYIEAAKKAANFILDELKEGKKLLHRYRNGEAGIPAHADDYAFLIWGLRELYRATFSKKWLAEAVALQEQFIALFWDKKQGGFFFTDERAEELLSRKKESYDGAIPSGNSVALLNLLKLGRITANPEWEYKAESLQKAFSKLVKKAPTGFTQLLQGVSFQYGTTHEITISGSRNDENTQSMLQKIWRSYLPNTVVVFNDPADPANDLAPYTQNQPIKNKQATAYVCQNYSCKMPTNSPEEMMKQLRQPSK